MKKILVAISGGVDSAAAAAILAEQGFEVGGVTMELFGDVPSAAAKDAKNVCDTLSIPHYIVNAADIFERRVMDYFVDEYKSGRTPNPCVACNRYLKFGLLMDEAKRLGYDGLATGHYAAIDSGQLKRGADANKDQSYFLYPILTPQINKIVFPLGKLTKNEVRTLAQKFNLPIASKSDSQDICFIPSGNYLDFLKSRGTGTNGSGAVGQIVDTAGKIIGAHTGIYNFTIGQRKGLGALGKRMYVKQINAADNTVTAAEEHQLGSRDITVQNVIISPIRQISANDRYLVQVRYKSKPVRAKITEIDRSLTTLRLQFDEPVKSVSPGQSAVIYDGDVVVAGGVIESKSKD